MNEITSDKFFRVSCLPICVKCILQYEFQLNVLKFPAMSIQALSHHSHVSNRNFDGMSSDVVYSKRVN